jgi:hypothetical protein
MVIFVNNNNINATNLISKAVTKFEDFPVSKNQVEIGKLLTNAFEGLKKYA